LLNNVVGLLSGSAPAVVGDYESIQTFTVGSGGSTSIDFTVIPSTYKHLQIRYSGFVSGDAWIRVGNGSVDTGGNYSRHSLYGTGSGTPSTYGQANATVMGFTYTSSSSNPSTAICDILDYANTSKYKTVRVLNGDDQNGSGIIMLASGSWRNTAAIDTINITPNSGSFAQHSSFALYGIKG
jgi:hypothetical protein